MLSRQVRLIAEPSGAVPLAVVLQHPSMFAGRNVVALISGGNLDDMNLLR
jgi:threonine dehydratase